MGKLSELLTKEAKSIERLKAFEPPEGYYLAFSGGKDSERKLKERPTAWQTAEEVMQWWLESDVLPGQYNLFELEEE